MNPITFTIEPISIINFFGWVAMIYFWFAMMFGGNPDHTPFQHIKNITWFGWFVFIISTIMISVK